MSPRMSKDLKFTLQAGAQIVVSGPDEATSKRYEFKLGTAKEDLECIRLVLDERCNFSRETGHQLITF